MNKQLCRWRRPPGEMLKWKTWDDESVVYNPLSGSTHLLDIVAATALKKMDDQPTIAENLAVQVALSLNVEPDSQLNNYIEALLGEFDRLGLVEKISQ